MGVTMHQETIVTFDPDQENQTNSTDRSAVNLCCINANVLDLDAL